MIDYAQRYVDRIESTYPNLKMLTPYVNSTTDIKFECSHCNSTFSRKPPEVFRYKTRYGCPKCNILERNRAHIPSLETFLDKLRQIHPHVQYVANYTNMTQPAQFKCLTCNFVFETKPHDLLVHSRHGCPNCARQKQGRHLDANTYAAKLREVHPKLQLLSPYVDSNHSVKVKCSTCDTIWNAKPLNLLNTKYGCPRCAKDHSAKSLEQFIADVKQANLSVEILATEYVSSKMPLKVQCTICHNIWQATPNSLLTNKSHCPECSLAKHQLAQANFAQKLSKIYKWQTNESFANYLNRLFLIYVRLINAEFRILDPFVSMRTKINLKCLRCNKIRHITPKGFLNNPVCLHCNKHYSKGERAIIKYLDQHKIKYQHPFIPRTLKDKSNLHFDFKIDDLLIEFNGRQHYEPIKYFGGHKAFLVTQKHDKLKQVWAEQHGYKLLIIKYTDDINKALSKILCC